MGKARLKSQKNYSHHVSRHCTVLVSCPRKLCENFAHDFDAQLETNCENLQIYFFLVVFFPACGALQEVCGGNDKI